MSNHIMFDTKVAASYCEVCVSLCDIWDLSRVEMAIGGKRLNIFFWRIVLSLKKKKEITNTYT